MTNIACNEEETILENIKNIILEKNDWMEIQEVADIFGVERQKQLFSTGHNSTIAQLINRYLKKQGFKTQKINFDEGNYSIWVCAPDVPENNLDKILKNKYDFNYTIAEKKSKIGVVKSKSIIEEILDDTDDENNEYLNKIIELINKGENIFITGYAGTGKSYILNKLKKRFKIDVTSATGLAAVNVQGQTIHSWAGVGICNKPVNVVVENIFKRSNLKKQILNCNILAIDEISMIDAQTFDYIDTVLRLTRNTDEPFGGIQVLLFGDFFQLPPVEKNEKGFCFTSNCWEELNLKTVFLEKIYRQTDTNFIRSLNNMRLNDLKDEDIQLLCSREIDYNSYDSDILHIFSTNKEADNYNNRKFNVVNNPVHTFLSVDKIHKKKSIIEINNENPNKGLMKFDLITWEMFDKYCKAPQRLELKEGCKVMLLKNHNFAKCLINGSCGTVHEVRENSILVKFNNSIEELIPMHTFEYYRDGELVASRDQYPLRLAYGITIHKSQGMTLDELVVDCNKIFECGQAYVALSRIKTIEGLYLRSFHPNKVVVNEEVVNFYDSLTYNLTQSKKMI
ncbi:MAG: PIF1 family DEAD/DEAH box helicase [Candidatus Gastranaerophilaceae bacterium]